MCVFIILSGIKHLHCEALPRWVKGKKRCSILGFFHPHKCWFIVFAGAACPSNSLQEPRADPGALRGPSPSHRALASQRERPRNPQTDPWVLLQPSSPQPLSPLQTLPTASIFWGDESDNGAPRITFLFHLPGEAVSFLSSWHSGSFFEFRAILECDEDTLCCRKNKGLHLELFGEAVHL